MTIQVVSPESVGISSDRLARIQPAIQRWIDKGVIAGARMMLARRGALVYSEQVGQLDKEKGIAMPDDAIFRIYSMTKPITCITLMTFYEEGRFRLDTPVAKFIPALGWLKVLNRDKPGAPRLEELQRPITIGDLMKHTAGFTYDQVDDSPVAELYRQAELTRNPGRSLAEFVHTLAEFPLVYQPGARWHYSVSIDVAAHLIEVLADKPLGEVFQERIFSPLGMVDTGFFVPKEKLSRCAAMYGCGDILAWNMTVLKMNEAYEKGLWGRVDVEDNYPSVRLETFARGGYGLFSTTRDYLRFILMLLDDGVLEETRILGRKTLELMHVNHLPAELLPLEDAGITFDGYGFGLGSRTMLDVGAAGILSSVVTAYLPRLKEKG